VSELAYLNLDLLVEQAEPDYRIRVLASPAGESRPASFRMPFSDLEVENFLLKIGRPRRNVRRISPPQATAIKDFGGRLFEAVFSPELHINLAISQNRADAIDAGLRIRLRFSDCPELSELPWEYLYDREHNRFLCLSDRTPLVRYLEVSDSVRVVPVTPPLRILVVIASPSDLQQLDSEQEWSNVTAALSQLTQRGRVEVVRLAKPTMGALLRQLRRDTYHIFHFIGHGGFDPNTQGGMLAMEDDHGRARLVGGDDLGMLLHNHRSLRLAVLNSCEGARGDRADPFSGTAQSLIQQGIPAVVAMQFEITDDAAITFGRGLYEAIADGYPLDAATTEARIALYTDGNLTEWGTPVLYLRAPDGRIFDIQPPSSAEQARQEAEQQAQREAAAQARQEAEQQAQREAAAQAQREAEQQAQREAAAQAQREAEARAQQEAEAQAQQEAEARTRQEAEQQAQREAEGRARQEAEQQARQEAAAQAQQEAEERTRQETRRKSRRTKVLVVGAVIVAAASAVGLLIQWEPTVTTEPHTGSPSSSVPSPPPTTTPVPPLPRSTPLTNTQLLVPVLVDGTYDIYLGDVTKNAPVRALIKGPGDDTNVTLSPDRASMIYLHEGVLQVAAADGTGSRPLFSSVPKQCAESNTRPGWNSADPTQIATACVDADGKAGVYLVTIDGKVIRKLSEGDYQVGDPGFSPDGKFVIFWAKTLPRVAPGFDGGDIVVASTDGKGKPRRVTRMTKTVYDADPAWSPKGDQLAFRRRDRTGDLKNSDVYVIDADGKSEAKPLADDPHADEQNPSWSPSGDEMAYKSNAKAAAWPGPTLDRVWVMNSNGNNQRVLWTSGRVALGAQIAPSWSSR
jgi:Tol biopolymer transport system component